MQPDHVPIPATIIYEDSQRPVDRSWTADGGLWLSLPDLALTTGWELKPEGVCRDDVCIPIPAARAEAFVQSAHGDTWFNLAEFARFIEQPCAHDATHNIWFFGAASQLYKGASPLMAPDFTLPDLEGMPHALSDYRGKKVFLVTWASW